jgi:hypothetical protein
MSLAVDVAATIVVPSTTMTEVPAAQLAKTPSSTKYDTTSQLCSRCPVHPMCEGPELQGRSPLQDVVVSWQELMLNSLLETWPIDRQSG